VGLCARVGGWVGVRVCARAGGGVRVTLGIHHAMHLHRIVICSLSGSKNFSTLSHKWQFFLKTVIDHKMSVFIFSTTFVQNMLILRRKEQDDQKFILVFL